VASLLLQSLPPSSVAGILEFRRPHVNCQSLISCQFLCRFSLASHASGLKLALRCSWRNVLHVLLHTLQCHNFVSSILLYVVPVVFISELTFSPQIKWGICFLSHLHLLSVAPPSDLCRTSICSLSHLHLLSVAPPSLPSSSLAVLLPHYFSSDFRNFHDKCAVLFGWYVSVKNSSPYLYTILVIKSINCKHRTTVTV
jgi:hypothetical protein